MKQQKKRAFCAESKGERVPEEEEGPQLGVVSDSGPLGAGGQSAVAGAGTVRRQVVGDAERGAATPGAVPREGARLPFHESWVLGRGKAARLTFANGFALAV